MVNNLNSLREQIKTKLQNLSPESCAISSQNIADKIIHSEIFIHSQKIACYFPIENEVNVWPIIKIIWEQRKSCYLPAFSPYAKHHLCFVNFSSGDQLLQAKGYKISEPKIIPEKVLAPEKLDVVIVPLVGFTNTRFRLGRGAGCYDRTFAFKKLAEASSKPYLIGVGYECQQVEFEPGLYDVAMDEIVVG